MNFRDLFRSSLETLKKENRYRTFVPLERHTKSAPYALRHRPDGSTQDVIVWCSNDYLGMSHHPEVIQTMKETVDLLGAGSGGTRNISGTAKLHEDLEKTVANLHGKEAGLTFTSGYSANKSSLSTLAQHIPDLVILSDEKNHASIIQGIRHGRCEKIVFKHNDMEDLEDCLSKLPYHRPKLIVFVSVYSMDGDFAKIEQIIHLAKKYNAMTFLDEVHAVGIYGDHGEGLAGMLGRSKDIDIIQANFAKAYGIVGGYIAADQVIVDFIRSHASGFIFTTSLPPATAAACMKSVTLLKHDRTPSEKLLSNAEYLKNALRQTHVNMIESDSHIIPLWVGDAGLCKKVCDHLLETFGHYVQPINFPTVPVGEERLRITVNPSHTHAMMDTFVSALQQTWEQLLLKKAA